MKQQIYNLIILDESGSMDCVCRQTISGCNETINTIKSAQRMYADTQEYYVSIFAFQGNEERPSRYLIKNVPASDVNHITPEDYKPWGSTPLNDATGSTLVDLKATVACSENAIGSVTIITDGMENASVKYSTERVARMIQALKEIGWNFNFIGANINVAETAKSYHIDNALEFQQDEIGTQEMFKRENKSRMSYYSRMNDVQECCMATPDMCANERILMAKAASANYFNEEEEEKSEEAQQVMQIDSSYDFDI